MKCKVFLLSILVSLIMAACGDSVSVPPDILGADCVGCGEWKELIVPTCTTAGERTRTCSLDPSHAGPQVVDPLGHDSGAWLSTASTCEALGTSELRCTRCDYVLDANPTPAYGHDWGSWTVITAPTCITTGEQKRTCSRSKSHTETQVIDPLGHDGGAWQSTASTCDELGTSELRCTRCSHVLGTSSSPELGHSWSDYIVTTSATCTTAGEQKRTCSRNKSHTETQVIDPLRHDSGAWHSTAATCTESGPSELRCTRCSHVLGTNSTPELGHKWTHWTIITAPTCTASGEQTRTCTINILHTETQVLDPLNHDSGAWHSTAATCEELGTSELCCTRCDHVLGTSPILALGHSWTNYIVTTTPTCTTAGEQERICSRDNSHIEKQVLDPLGHDSGAWHSTAEGTCTGLGTRELRCTRCDYVIITDPTPALGHSWGSYIVTTVATCTTAGVETRTCTKDSSHKETRPITALGHDGGKWHSTAPTCTESGPSELRCTRCDHVLDTDSTPALGHDWGSWITKTLPTCTIAGVETRTCSRDSSHTQTQSIAIVSTAHNWGSWVVTTPATETSDGVQTRTCSYNGTHKETRPLVNAKKPNITGHPTGASYTQGAVAPALMLTVAADSPDGGSLSYQWYSHATNSNSGGTIIPGATGSGYSFTPSTTTMGTTYYYVVVTNTNNGVNGAKTATATSNVAAVTVLVHAATPNITGQPTGATYMKSAAASALTVTATSPDSGTGGVLSYKWYSNTINSNSSGSPVLVGTNSASYTPSTTTAGMFYYYVVVTNTNNTVNGTKTATATSNVAAVTVIGDLSMSTGIGMKLVVLPAGTFTMGSPTTEEYRETDETQHSVTLTQGFYISKYEVTQEQYLAVMGTNPSYFYSSLLYYLSRGVRRPVERVSWYDAIVFCNKLSIMEGLDPVYRISGRTNPSDWGSVPTSSNSTWNAVEMIGWPDNVPNGYRLPTEAEWEYACRAATQTAYCFGNIGVSDQANNYSWSNNNSGGLTNEVGLLSANAWGLHDMHGNVWEWCWDWYGTYASGPQANPKGPSVGSDRIIRGGSWYNQRKTGNFRSASRDSHPAFTRDKDNFGFRVMRRP